MRGARIAVITGASSGLGRAFALETGRLGGIDEIWLIAGEEKIWKDWQESFL